VLVLTLGQITALTNAKDHERLALLKEVAGTKVYEQRRTESLRIMAETDSKRSKISELLEYIESRLAELEEEKEELKEFQEKDKERRCLEYALYQRELEDVAEALVEIEEDRKAELHGANIRREKFSEREKEIQDLERKIQEAKHAQETLAQTKQDAQAELTDFVRSRTEIECIIEDLKAAGLSAGGKRQELEEELEQIQERIAGKEESLAEVLPEWENWKGKEAVEKRRLDEASARLASLFAKQGRASKFRTKGERDNFLRHEIESMKAYKVTQASALENSRSELDSLRGSESEIQEQIQGVQENIDDGRKKVKDLGDQVTELKEKYKDLTEKRKDLWREDTKLDSLVSRASEELRSAERGLAGMMDKVRPCTQGWSILAKLESGYWPRSSGSRQHRRAIQARRRLRPSVPALRSLRSQVQHRRRADGWQQLVPRCRRL
jgi:structural maintenance of chromosome 3 (chondroitin sulfate proteoglycan 6)